MWNIAQTLWVYIYVDDAGDIGNTVGCKTNQIPNTNINIQKIIHMMAMYFISI